LIAFENPDDEEDAGYILMDPGFNVDEPVVITRKVSPIVRSSTYKLGETGSIESYGKGGKLIVTFPPQEIINPDRALTKSALLAYTAFRVVARAGNKKFYIELNLRESELKVQLRGKERKVKITEAGAVEEAISEELAELLGYQKAELDEGARDRLLATLHKVILQRVALIDLQDSKLEKPQNAIGQD
jgi:hypothetical protein